MNKTVCCMCLTGLLATSPAWAVTNTFLSSVGGLWTSTANWSRGSLPAANETADLSAVTGTNTISLTADVTVGEIVYNPAFSGTTNTLTIMSDTSRTITLSNTTTPHHLQAGTGAVLEFDADLRLAAATYKDGHGIVDLKRKLVSSAFQRVTIEQGKLLVGGEFLTAAGCDIFAGRPNSDTGVPYPELILRDGASSIKGENLIFGANRLAAGSTNAHAVVTQAGGVIDRSKAGTGAPFLNAFYTGSTSVYNLVGGTLNMSNKTVHVGYTGNGTFNQSGGTSIITTVTMANGAAASGTYTLTGGELWLGGTVSKGSGTSAFNIGGGCIYPFNTGFTINGNTVPKLTGTNGLTRFGSTNGAYTNGIGDLSGPGGLVKEGADTLNLAGTHTFTGPVIVSNGTLNVNAAINGLNAVLVAGGRLNLNAGYQAKFSSLMVTGGVFQVASNSTLVITTASDPWVRVAGTGLIKFLAGAVLPYMQGLDVSGAGAIDLSAGGVASVYRLTVGGVAQRPGLYTSANCSVLTGAGTLAVDSGCWTGAGGNTLWSSASNWVGGKTPNGPLAIADVSGAVSNEVPAATLIMDLGAVTNNNLVLSSGVAGAILTNTCPAGVTNTLYVPSEGIVYVGESETLVLDHDLCLMGNYIYKRGGGTLVLRRKTFALPSLVSVSSTITLGVEGGKVICSGPMTNVLVMVGKPDRSVSGITPEFILEDTPEAAVNGTSFFASLSYLATSLNPGNGVFTQKGGTITPGISWATKAQIGFAAAGASLGGTGTYNMVGGTLRMTNSLVLAVNNGRGTLNQSGGVLDLYSFTPAGGTVNLTGGLLTPDNFSNGGSAPYCTFYLGGGRLEPKAATVVTIVSPTVFTGENGDMTFAPAAGRAVTLSGATSGTGGFVKDGAGTLTLSGAGAHSGAATVSNGTLVVSGSLNGTNNVLLLNGTLSVTAGGTARLGLLAITNGSVALASGVVALAKRLFIEGAEWPTGVYTSTNCSKLAGSGVLLVGAELGQWTGGGSDNNWNTANNWAAGVIPNNAYAVVNLSAAVSNAAPVRTLILNIGGITNKQMTFSSGVTGATLTNTCPASVTNTLFLASEGVIDVGEGQTLVLDHDLCIMGNIHKRGLGTLVLKRSVYTLPSLVTPVSAIYFFVDGGKVVNEGPMRDMLISVGKLSRAEPEPTPEFILADKPDTSLGGTCFITTINAGATAPGPGVFTQNGGTVNPAISWGVRIALGHTTVYVNTPGTGTYNLVNGTLTVTNELRFGRNGPSLDGHYGIFNQSGGTADLQVLSGTWGEVNLTGGLFKLNSLLLSLGGTNVTFYFGGGRLEPKTTTWVTIPSPTVFTGVNGNMTFATESGRTVQLSGASTGIGGFVKEGPGSLMLAATNAFAGTAQISAGTCTVTTAGCLTQCTNLLVAADAHLILQRTGAALNTNLLLKVASDGKVHLDFTGEVEVGRLILNGYEQPGRGRRYGASAHTSPLDSVKNDFFTGTGVLKVAGPRGPEGTLFSLR